MQNGTRCFAVLLGKRMLFGKKYTVSHSNVLSTTIDIDYE
jgi:hypothetical protein